MAKSARIKVLESCLRAYVQPELERHGFSFHAPHRSFFRYYSTCIQLIQFQPGIRSAEGTFAVNLAVYHPDYHDPAASSNGEDIPRECECLMDFRKRLGTLRENWRTRIFKRILKDPSNWLSWYLSTSRDKWWRFDENESLVANALDEVLKLLESKGFSWLDEHSNEKLLAASHSKVIERIRGPA